MRSTDRRWWSTRLCGDRSKFLRDRSIGVDVCDKDGIRHAPMVKFRSVARFPVPGVAFFVSRPLSPPRHRSLVASTSLNGLIYSICSTSAAAASINSDPLRADGRPVDTRLGRAVHVPVDAEGSIYRREKPAFY